MIIALLFKPGHCEAWMIVGVVRPRCCGAGPARVVVVQGLCSEAPCWHLCTWCYLCAHAGWLQVAADSMQRRRVLFLLVCLFVAMS